MAGNENSGKYKIYPTLEDFQECIDGYFNNCHEKEELPNMLGFIAFSELAGRSSLDYYEDNPIYSDAIKKLRARCYAEKFQAAAVGKMNATIFIFDAVNNHNMINTRSDNKNDNKNEDKVTVKVEELPESVKEILESVKSA